MRTFLAFPVPDTVIDYTQRMQSFLKERGVKGKWVNPEQQHITALFLGDQSQEMVDMLASELRQWVSRNSALSLKPESAGAFGRPPRVLFLGWDREGEQAFSEFVEGVKRCVEKIDMNVDPKTMRREAIPHLTLVRFRHGKEARALKPLCDLKGHTVVWHETPPQPDFQSVTLDRLVLYESVLHPDGPEYRRLHEFELAHA